MSGPQAGFAGALRGTSLAAMAPKGPAGGAARSAGLKSIQIIVNGEEREVRDGLSIEELLRSLGLDRGSVAIEVNAALVPRARFDHHRLESGDRLEIVTFVGGG